MSADDLLFEPLSAPSSGMGSGASTGAGIIHRGSDFSVEIQRSSPKHVYVNAARNVIDHAVACFPSLHDIRLGRVALPANCLNLIDLTERYYEGHDQIWMSHPTALQPICIQFQGKYGYLKYFRMSQALYTPSKNGFFFWIETDSGQIAMLDIGVVCAHSVFKAYHLFTNQADATAYFKT